MCKNSHVIPGALPPMNNEGSPNTSTYTRTADKSNTSIPPPMDQLMNLGGITSKTMNVLPYDYKNTSNPNKSHADCDYKETQNNSSSNMEGVIIDLNQVLENAPLEMNAKKLNDIKKRVSTMETKWKSGVLNAEVQNGMAKVAKCLLSAQEAVDKLSHCPEDLELKQIARDSIDEAEKIQRALTVDWPSMCGTWMVGIKPLIQELKPILVAKGKLEEEKQTIGISVPLYHSCINK